MRCGRSKRDWHPCYRRPKEVIAVVRSVGNDHDTRRLSQRLHCSIGCPVDLNPRFGGRLLLVISAGTVEHSVAQNYSGRAAFIEQRPKGLSVG